MIKSLLITLVVFALGMSVALAGSQGGETWNGMPLMVLCGLFAYGINWLVFIPAYAQQTEHYFDLTGSITYISITVFALAMAGLGEPRTVILGSMVLVWAIRLGSFLFVRVKSDGKDSRFDDLKPNFFRFLNVWTIQGLWVLFTMSTALAAMTSAATAPLGIYAAVGSAVWIMGFGFEAIADAQKRVWRRDPANKGGFIGSGLWSWSQHPNYFGEITLWLGVAIVAFPVLSGWQYVCLISPVFVYLLLTKVSGIPLLDQQAKVRFEGNQAYADYIAKTGVLFPRPPKG
jgi:steroid 5-alpha reductase family enzyme